MSFEPVVSLCEALAEQGLDVTLATPVLGFPDNTVEKEVRYRGIPCFERFRLKWYFP